MADSFESVIISRQPDRKFWWLQKEDPAIRTDMEGGYVASRPRHNRDPLRRTWTFGYTDIDATDRAALENFWDSQKGGSKVWIWLDFASWDAAAWAAEQVGGGAPDKAPYRYFVRFAKDYKLAFEPKGYGRNFRFDCGPISIEEA
jgi:hypothetical protein